MERRYISEAHQPDQPPDPLRKPLNILWIKSGLLHPVNFGGRILSFQILKRLAARHRITYLALDEENTGPDDRARAVEYCHEQIVVAHAKHAHFSAGFWLDLARNVFSPLPYFVMAYESKAMTRAIFELVQARRFDLVVCDSVATSINLPSTVRPPVLLLAHNVEAVIWRRLAETHAGWLQRAYLREQWRKASLFEQRMAPRFNQVVTVSPEESGIYRSEYGASSVSEIPTGVDTDYFIPQLTTPIRPRHLVFVGAMDWLPNHDGMTWFVRQVLPIIRAALPDTTLAIVGRSPLPELWRLCQNDSGIVITGRVDDVRPWLAEAALVVVPLRVGAGTRLKIFEAMAMEKPVVSTSIGAEGLPVEDGVDLLLADTPEEFAGAVIRRIASPEIATPLVRYAAERVRRDHGWAVVANRFEEICQLVVQRKPT